MRAGLIGAATLALSLNGCSGVPAVTGDTAVATLGDEVSVEGVVADQAAFAAAMAAAQPGDTIVLANGNWRDFDMLVEGEGTENAPITVRSETPGEVILSGQSSLRLAGRHLVVSGLVFRDGYTPRSEVISFRKDGDNLAFNARVTETVIDNYSNPDRRQRDVWVMMYGQNNVFDRNHLSGKVNSGPTMAVRLNTEDSQQNNHLIAHNYFGPRPIFGSNGGETLRIGTSHFSLTDSLTTVENNYFDRCSGEVEIISSKSGSNTFKGNTFYQSRGTLTLRHGSGAVIEGNLFDGDNQPYTGGVRVINGNQTVRNNQFRNLTGERFSGALVVMNGVPNSPINRYHQVEGAVIENNTFDGVQRIELGEGSDAERSAVPIDSVFRGNIVIGSGSDTPFSLYDDMSGIEFTDNLTNLPPPDAIASGFTVYADASAPPADPVGVSRDETGVSWYPKPAISDPFDGGIRTEVEPGPGALAAALSAASAGDTLVLAPGLYPESTLINLRVPVTVEAADPDNPPMVTFERPNLILLAANGSIRMSGLTVSGEASPDSRGNSFITTTSTGGSGNHMVSLSGMTFVDFDVNRDFSIVSAAKGTFYDKIKIDRSSFRDVSGSVVDLDAETDDYGIYNAEYVIVEDSVFENIGGPAISVYRGGRDESTFGPHVWVRGSTFETVATGGGPLLELHGVQNLELKDNRATNAGSARFTITTGIPKQAVSGNVTIGEDAPDFLSTIDLRQQ